MLYRLNDEFQKIEQREGIMQNLSRHAEIEVVSCTEEPQKDSGLLLLPLEKINFTVKSVEMTYARCARIDGTHANLAVVNFKKPASAGEGAGGAVGSIVYGHFVLPGYVKAAGQLLKRDDYLALYACAVENNLVLSEADWENGMQGMYGDGDGSTTFRVPDLRGQFLRGLDDEAGVDVDRVLGSIQEDAIRNINAYYGWTGVSASLESSSAVIDDVTQNGAFYGKATGLGYTWTRGNYYYGNQLYFDASRVVPTAEENRPKNIALIAQIKY